MLSEPDLTAGTTNTVNSGVALDSGVGGVQYNFCVNSSDSITGCTQSGWQSTSNFNFTGLSGANPYYYFVQVRDTLLNTSGWSGSTSSIQDSIGPVVSANNNSSTWENALIKATVTASDAGIGLAEIRYNWKTKTMNTACTSNGNIIASGTILDAPDGGTTLYLCARDSFGNVTNWSGIYRWDNKAPILSATNSSGEWRSSQIIATVSASDDGDQELMEVRYSWGLDEMNLECDSNGGGTNTSDNAQLASPMGGTVLHLCARDAAGNVSTWNGSYRWEGTKPSTPGIMTTSWIGEHFVNTTFLALSTGSSDTGGSEIDTYTLMMSDDYTDITPECNIAIKSGLLTPSYLVGSENPLHLPANGYRKLYCWVAVDHATNSSDPSLNEYIRMDNAAPTTTVDIVNSTYGPNTFVDDSTINGTSQDTGGSGLISTQITIQKGITSIYWTGIEWSATQTWLDITTGTTAWKYTMDDTNFSNGATYYIKARGTDNVGNVTTVFGTDNFLYISIGPSTPLDLIFKNPTTSPGNVTTPIITVNGVSDGDLVKLYTDSCGTQIVGSATATGTSVDITSNELIQGSHSFTANSTDPYNNISSCSTELPYILDTTNPTTSVSIEKSIYSPSLFLDDSTIKGSAEDIGGATLDKIQIYIQRSNDSQYWMGSDWVEGKTWIDVTDGTTAWKYSIDDENAFNNGIIYTVVARAIDKAGNTTSGVYGIDSFTYNNLVPTNNYAKQYKSNGTTQIPVGESTQSGESSVVLKVNVPSAILGNSLYSQFEVKRVGVNFDGITGIYESSPVIYMGTTLTNTVTISPISKKYYHWRYRTIDELGNASSWASFGNNNEVDADFGIEVVSNILPPPGVSIMDPTFSEEVMTNLVNIITVGVMDEDSGNPIAQFDIDTSLVTGDLIWEDLIGESSGNQSVLHYPEGFSNLPGQTGDEFILFVRKGDGTKVLICPHAATLGQVTLDCANGYLLDERDSNVSIVNIKNHDYWRVTGLTGTGGMSVIEGINDIMSRVQAGEYSDHRIIFGTNYGIYEGENFEIVFDEDNKGFDLSEISYLDMVLSDSESNNRVLGSSAGAGTWGVAIDSMEDKIILTAPTDNVGIFENASQITLQIGGANKIKNPVNVGLVFEKVIVNNYMGEEGLITIVLVDSDQLNIIGYIDEYIHFDIDTGILDNVNCEFDACLEFEDGPVGNNYTVDLGELTSAVVNKSQNSVMHATGTIKKINSIYFDLTANSPIGTVVTVISANGGLQGPGTNFLTSVASGDNIIANSGQYGINMPVAANSTSGSILFNTLCNTDEKYCGPQNTESLEIFNTNGSTVDKARIRLDVAAASKYTNIPGKYTDSLTFIATSEF
jgi:hypothetical protein